MTNVLIFTAIYLISIAAARYIFIKMDMSDSSALFTCFCPILNSMWVVFATVLTLCYNLAEFFDKSMKGLARRFFGK